MTRVRVPISSLGQVLKQKRTNDPFAAISQAFLNRPTPQSLQAQELQNQLIQSQLATQGLQQQQLQAGLTTSEAELARQQGIPTAVTGLGEVLNLPEVETPLRPGQIGPGAPIAPFQIPGSPQQQDLISNIGTLTGGGLKAAEQAQLIQLLQSSTGGTPLGGVIGQLAGTAATPRGNLIEVLDPATGGSILIPESQAIGRPGISIETAKAKAGLAVPLSPAEIKELGLTETEARLLANDPKALAKEGIKLRKFETEREDKIKQVSIPGFRIKEGILPTATESGKVKVSLQATSSILDLTKKLREDVAEFGTQILPGEAKRSMNRAFNDIILTLKEAKNLGVLQKIDVDALEKIIPNPALSFDFSLINKPIQAESFNTLLTQFEEQLIKDTSSRVNLSGFESGSGDFLQDLNLSRNIETRSGSEITPEQAREMLIQKEIKFKEIEFR